MSNILTRLRSLFPVIGRNSLLGRLLADFRPSQKPARHNRDNNLSGEGRHRRVYLRRSGSDEQRY
jgi:hypothetical protein